LTRDPWAGQTVRFSQDWPFQPRLALPCWMSEMTLLDSDDREIVVARFVPIRMHAAAPDLRSMVFQQCLDWFRRARPFTIWLLPHVGTGRKGCWDGITGNIGTAASDCAYQSGGSSPYVVDDKGNRSGSRPRRSQVPGMPQVQDGFRQRMGRRTDLPALQGQFHVAEWWRPGNPRLAAKIDRGPSIVEP